MKEVIIRGTDFTMEFVTAPGPGGNGKFYRLDVKLDYGAIGDGIADDSAAFKAAFDACIADYNTALAALDGNRMPKYEIYIPPGTYKITQSNAMMGSANFSPSMAGIVWRGAGDLVSVIHFQPTLIGDQYLLYNNNCMLRLGFANFTFVADAKTSHFMYSRSTGQAQNYKFENVSWAGTFGYMINLDGTNTNSEMAWYHCAWRGDCIAALYVAQSVGTNGDQFLNYNFYDCNFEVGTGSFCDMAYGSNINIWGGSFLYYGSGTTAETFFMLRNSTHNGAPRFKCSGVRFEIPRANVKMIDCSWGKGTVMFDGCDNSSQQYLPGGITNSVNVKFDAINDSGPVVTFVACSLQGRHEYRWSNGANSQAGRASYIGCEMWHHTDPNTFISYTMAETWQGGRPLIKFSGCRGGGTGQNEHTWDTTLGWDMRAQGFTERRVLKLGNPVNGGLPGGGTSRQAFLPMGAIITRIALHMAPGATASTVQGWSFAVKTGEASPTTLATATPLVNNPSQGFSIANETFFICNSDAKRQIILSSAVNVDADPIGICLIDYIA